MPGKESIPVYEEPLLEKEKKFVWRILGLSVLIGASYLALKNIIIPWLGVQANNIRKLIK
ncbi:MAG TPA: hypothetical protein VMW29_01710 [Candidatus Bathyarchaeia archaeon]|nr:hypothetical protein [Candidatus Bathyarchaeia archaeon]